MAVQNPTSNYNWSLPTPGASVGVWGQMLNEILGDDATGIDALLAQRLPLSGGTLTGHLNITGGGTLRIAGNTVITAARTLQNVNIAAGLVNSGTLSAARIPDLPASRITSGQFSVSRIPDLPAHKITSGVLLESRIPTMNAAKITSGYFPVTRGGTGRQSFDSGHLLRGAGSNAVATLSPGGAGGFVYSDGSNWTRRSITVSTGGPSGTPQDGDLWLRY